jgi:hypothetical protein
MYVACNNSVKLGFFLGDVITLIKTAYLFVENEPHDEIILSLLEHDPLNFLWSKFIDSYDVRVLWDDWVPEDKEARNRFLQERIDTHKVHKVSFDTYKELYARLHGEERQCLLCGEHRGLGKQNIFEYYYYGQQQCASNPKGLDQFNPGLIKYQRQEPTPKRSVFVVPYEHSQKNRIFTLQFWEKVTSLLLKEGVHVTLNSLTPMKNRWHPLLTITFKPYQSLINQVSSQQLVVCGNTGIGWVAASTGVPFIAMEKDMFLEEYSFEKCGCSTLVETVREPDPMYAAERVLHYLDQEFENTGQKAKW